MGKVWQPFVLERGPTYLSRWDFVSLVGTAEGRLNFEVSLS